MIICAVARPAPAGAQSVLLGRVVDDRGLPVTTARVSISRLGLTAAVTSEGRFEFVTIPRGRFAVATAAVGFAPDVREMGFAGNDTVRVDIRLGQAAQRLDSVVVSGNGPPPLSPQMRIFEERRRKGIGVFLTRADLARREHSTLTDVLRQVPGMKFVRRPERCGGGFALASNRGGALSWLPWMTCFDGFTPFSVECYLTVYLDWNRIWIWGSQEPPRIDETSVASLEAVELYRGPSELPVELQGTGSACGAVLLWSRTGEGGQRPQ
ncbi:MAG: carboxypeptidase regulatory-like domain-containing protein [Gemmatimonadales bacterium]